jgi:hypothetical protein
MAEKSTDNNSFGSQNLSVAWFFLSTVGLVAVAFITQIINGGEK